MVSTDKIARLESSGEPCDRHIQVPQYSCSTAANSYGLDWSLLNSRNSQRAPTHLKTGLTLSPEDLREQRPSLSSQPGHAASPIMKNVTEQTLTLCHQLIFIHRHPSDYRAITVPVSPLPTCIPYINLSVHVFIYGSIYTYDMCHIYVWHQHTAPCQHTSVYSAQSYDTTYQ